MRVPPGCHSLCAICVLAAVSASGRVQAQTPAAAVRQTLSGTNGVLNDDQASVVADFLQTQIATFPIPASAAAFTFDVRDPQGGPNAVRSESYGPQFIRSATTSGRGTFAVGFATQVTRWRSLDGINLRTGGLELRNDAARAGDLARANARLAMRTVTSLASVIVGLHCSDDA